MILRSSAAALVVAVSSFAAADSVASPARVRFVGKVASGRALVVETKDGPRTAMTLGPWATVEELIVSPSRARALVYAQTKVGATRTVFLVNLETLRVDATYRPGAGGSFYFTPTEGVVQIWGCGTSCAQLSVRDRHGKELKRLMCDGIDDEHELSPDRARAVCFHDEQVEVVDTATGRTLSLRKNPCEGLIGARDKVRFTKSDVQFVCP